MLWLRDQSGLVFLVQRGSRSAVVQLDPTGKKVLESPIALPNPMLFEHPKEGRFFVGAQKGRDFQITEFSRGRLAGEYLVPNVVTSYGYTDDGLAFRVGTKAPPGVSIVYLPHRYDPKTRMLVRTNEYGNSSVWKRRKVPRLDVAPRGVVSADIRKQSPQARYWLAVFRTEGDFPGFGLRNVIPIGPADQAFVDHAGQFVLLRVGDRVFIRSIRSMGATKRAKEHLAAEANLAKQELQKVSAMVYKYRKEKDGEIPIAYGANPGRKVLNLEKMRIGVSYVYMGPKNPSKFKGYDKAFLAYALVPDGRVSLYLDGRIVHEPGKWEWSAQEDFRMQRSRNWRMNPIR